MAITRPSSLVDAISGDIGSVNFVQTRSGTVLRQKAHRNKHTTTIALQRQSAYAQGRATWQNFTDTERNAWRIAAAQKQFQNRLAIPRNLTGYQLFMKLFLISIDENIPQLTPPALFPSSALINPTLEIQLDTDYHWEVDNIFLPLGPDAHTYGARTFSPAPVEYSTHWRLLKVARLGFAEKGNHFMDEWNAVLGVPVVGERVGCRFFIRFDDELPSLTIELWTDVIAAP